MAERNHISLRALMTDNPAASQKPEHAEEARRDARAHRQSQVRAAAEREAADIVNALRSDIRRSVVKARRELLALAEQIQAVTEKPTDSIVRQGAGGATQQIDTQTALLAAGEGDETRDRVLQ